MRSLKHRALMYTAGAVALALAGCDLSALDPNAQVAAAKEAEGKAVGGACRHSGRALEECYAKNPKISKAAIFTGWREMDGYMRENNIEIIVPATTTAESENAQRENETEAGSKAKSAADSEPDAKKKAAEAPSDNPAKRATSGAAGVKKVRLDV